mmetsp:Transcript_24259/g.69762  ORF Transcript_24259/g.69762 Transcript_24259/m.69762 type:complete len:337 (+) Transcript_24259:670-1680(+)
MDVAALVKRHVKECVLVRQPQAAEQLDEGLPAAHLRDVAHHNRRAVVLAGAHLLGQDVEFRQVLRVDLLAQRLPGAAAGNGGVAFSLCHGGGRNSAGPALALLLLLRLRLLPLASKGGREAEALRGREGRPAEAWGLRHANVSELVLHPRERLRQALEQRRRVNARHALEWVHIGRRRCCCRSSHIARRVAGGTEDTAVPLRHPGAAPWHKHGHLLRRAHVIELDNHVLARDRDTRDFPERLEAGEGRRKAREGRRGDGHRTEVVGRWREHLRCVAELLEDLRRRTDVKERHEQTPSRRPQRHVDAGNVAEPTEHRRRPLQRLREVLRRERYANRR